MAGLAQLSCQSTNNASSVAAAANGFWSNHLGGDVSYDQLQKFWSELPLQARKELLIIEKQAVFELARKNMYCSRCTGLLLDGLVHVIMYGKSLERERADGNLPSNISGASKNQGDGGTSLTVVCQDEVQDPSVHPWGGLTATEDGSLTLIDCYICSMSFKGLQNVFDNARARERERELLYPDACGGGGRGWTSQEKIASYGKGHGTRETCALHTAKVSCDTLVDFWSALGEETQQSLLEMHEEDFMERLMRRFESKKFCRDCRRNVIREFKELKELQRLQREPRCTSWFCAADTAFQYEVSNDTVQADWQQTFTDTIGIYHHFEWAVGTGEGKSDILEFENVGMNLSVQVNGLDLSGVSVCCVTLKAWKLDGQCTELSVKAHALKGQQCVHCRLVVGDDYLSITRGESIKRFFEHAEEAEEEEEEDSMDGDENELDGECSRPQKHAKSPELARQFLLDSATVIFKEHIQKAFREGTTRQNAHSIFVCLTLKLLEERVHVACKEIITLEKQMKLLEEEEREKREEEERKERRRTKEKEKKLRRKERLKGKGRDRERSCSESNETANVLDVSNIESPPTVDEEPSHAISCTDTVSESGDTSLASPEVQDELLPKGHASSRLQSNSHDSSNGEVTSPKDEAGVFTVQQSKFSRRMKSQKEVQADPTIKCSDRRGWVGVAKSGPLHYCDDFESPSRGINGSNRQHRSNAARLSTQNSSKCETKSGSAMDSSKQFYCGKKYNQTDYGQENCGMPKGKSITVNNHSSRSSLHPKQAWGAMESQKYPRSNSDSKITMNSSTVRIEETKCPSSNVPNMSSTSSSDNCSSCFSEGDSNTASSSLGNMDSSSTSDSEYGSQHSEGRDTVLNIQNSLSECHLVDLQKYQNTNGGGAFGRTAKTDENPDHKRIVANMGSQHQGLLPQMHNQNVQLPAFQAPTTGHYRQNPWQAAPANGLMSIPNPDHYLHPGPLGYGLNGNSQFCKQYSAVHNQVNPCPFPVHHPIAKANPMNYEAQSCMSKPGAGLKPLNAPVASPSSRAPPCGCSDSPAKLHDDSGFSLFHFGGPVALLSGNKSDNFPPEENVWDFSSEHSADPVDSDHCKKETTVEEYNLFARRFSIF